MFALISFRSSNTGNLLWASRDEFSDVTIRFGRDGEEGEEKAHKIILASASPVLMAELKSKNSIHLQNVCKEDFILILEFLYRGEVTVPTEKQDTLFTIGNQLKILPLLDELVKSDPGRCIGQKSNSKTIIHGDLFENEGISQCGNQKVSAQAKMTDQNNLTVTNDVINYNEEIKVSIVKSATSINDLPNELLEHIFVRLSTSDLLVNVARVSKRFYKVVKNPSVHRVVTIFPHNEFPHHELQWEQRAATFISKAIFLEERHIKRESTTYSWELEDVSEYGPFYKTKTCPFFQKLVMLATLQLENLKVLEICPEYGFISLNGIAMLRKAKWWTKVTEISFKIEKADFHPTGEKDLTTALMTLGQDGNLRYLNANLPERFYANIAIRSKKLKSMKRMPAIMTDSFHKIVEEKNAELKELEICSDFSPLAIKLIPQFENLTFLGIKSKNFSCFEILPRLKHLKSLDIFISLPAIKQVGPQRFKLSLPFKCLQNLESIKFQLDQIETTAMAIYKSVFNRFAEACPNLRNLRITEVKEGRPSFHNRYREDLASQLLSPFINVCPSLETMIMEVPSVSKHPFRLLSHIQEKLTSIRFIHLGISVEHPFSWISEIPNVRNLLHSLKNFRAIGYAGALYVKSSVSMLEISKLIEEFDLKFFLYSAIQVC